MSGEVASREAQAAEVVMDAVRGRYPLLGDYLPADVGAVAVEALAAAVLLAPPPPRTWTAGDQGPISASVVTDAGGEPWLYVGAGMWFDGSTRIGWYGLLDKRGPVTEVLTRAGQ